MGVRLGRHARGLFLIFSRRHIVALSTPYHGHCLVQYCDTNSMARIDWFELLCVCRLAISLERSVTPCLTLPVIVCIVRSVTHYYGIHTMDDKTIAVLLALKSIRQLCEDEDADLQEMIESLTGKPGKLNKDDRLWLESMYGQSMVWGRVGTRVGNMINETLFESLDKMESD